MQLLSRYIILLRTVRLPSIKKEASLVLMIISDCDLQVKHFLVRDHNLHHEVRLHEVQVLGVPGVGRQLRFRRVLKQQDEALARLVIGLLHLPTETPTTQGVLVYKEG